MVCGSLTLLYCFWAADPKGTMSYRTRGNFRPSVGGRGSLRGNGPGRVAGGLEQGGWGLRRVSKGPGAGAWRGPRGWGGGGELDPGGPGRTFVRSLVRTDGNSPLCSIGHRPLRVRCPKKGRSRSTAGAG